MLFLLLAILSSSVLAVVLKYLNTDNTYGVYFVNYGTCALLAFLSMSPKSLWNGDPLPLGLGAFSGLLYLAALVAYGASIRKSGAVLSSVFSRLGVLVPILLSVCLFGERPSPVQTVGLVLAAAAVVVMNLGSAAPAPDGAKPTGTRADTPCADVPPAAPPAGTPCADVPPAAPFAGTPCTDAPPAAPLVGTPCADAPPAAPFAGTPCTDVPPAAPPAGTPCADVPPAAPLAGPPQSGASRSAGLRSAGLRSAGLRAFLPLLLVLVLNGSSDSMSKVFAQAGNRRDDGLFVFYTFLFAGLFTLVPLLRSRLRLRKRDLLFGAAVGVPNFLASRFLLASLTDLPAFLVYPAYSVGAIAVISAASFLLFREKLSGRQLAGVALILCALVLLNL